MTTVMLPIAGVPGSALHAASTLCVHAWPLSKDQLLWRSAEGKPFSHPCPTKTAAQSENQR